MRLFPIHVYLDVTQPTIAHRKWETKLLEPTSVRFWLYWVPRLLPVTSTTLDVMLYSIPFACVLPCLCGVTVVQPWW